MISRETEGTIDALSIEDLRLERNNATQSRFWPDGYAYLTTRLANIEQQKHDEQRREDVSTSRRLVRWTIGLVLASWILNFATIAGIWDQHQDAAEQRQSEMEQRKERRRSAQEQRQDARDLLSAQIGVELDKEWSSDKMLRARGELASELLKNKQVTATAVYDFFEKQGLYTRKGYLDPEFVYELYSYWIVRYWLASQNLVTAARTMEHGSDYYVEFEHLYNREQKEDAKRTRGGEISLSQKEIDAFLEDEIAQLEEVKNANATHKTGSQ